MRTLQITFRARLDVLDETISAQPVGIQIDGTHQAMQIISVGPGGVVIPVPVTFTQTGYCLFKNLDDTHLLEVGYEIGVWDHQIEPGQTNIFPLQPDEATLYTVCQITTIDIFFGLWER